MIERRKTKRGQIRYRVRIHEGGKRYRTIGTFAKLPDAKKADARATLEPAREKVTVAAYTDKYLAWYAGSRKRSSVQLMRRQLEAFKAEHGHRQLASIEDHEAEQWVDGHAWTAKGLRTMFNHAIGKGLIARNPFVGLVEHTPGRAHLDPLTVDDVDKLADAARDGLAALGETQRAETLRALILFCAYTGIRQGEAFALEWTDIDFDRGRVRVDRRLYQGHIDLPKSGVRRQVLMPVQARNALLLHGRRPEGLVFVTKTGKRLSQSTFASLYWPFALARLGRKVDFHELRHFAGHWFYVVNDVPSRVAAAQLGHSSPRMVEDLYGHFRSGALDELEGRLDARALHVLPGGA